MRWRGDLIFHTNNRSYHLLLGLSFLLGIPSFSAGQNPPSRPILFVHGFCASADSWESFRDSLFNDLHAHVPTLYPQPTNADSQNPSGNYDVYYDSKADTTTFIQNGHFFEASSVPSNTRFFSIGFYDPYGGQFDPAHVVQISVLNQADQLAHVIAEIAKITRVEDVIVIAHSLGGLVTRAYLENLASHGNCSTYSGGANGAPDYGNGTCVPGQTPYQANVAELIALDTPNAGTNLVQSFLDGLYPGCIDIPSTARAEMVPNSRLLQTLNYYETDIVKAAPIPSKITVQSIESFYSDNNALLTLLGWAVGSQNDTVVGFESQSMELSLNPLFKSGAQFADWGNSYTVENISGQPPCQQNILNLGAVPVLHYIECVGQQPQTQSLVSSLVKSVVSTQNSVVSISPGGVLNDASYKIGAPVAPGTIVAVYGNFLLSSPATTQNVPWPTSLDGVSLQFGNGTSSPLNYVSAGQVNLQVPWELEGQSTTSLTATVNGQSSPAQSVNLAQYSPGIFTTNGQGSGQGAVLDTSYRLLDSSNPATAGSAVALIFCTGLGPVTNQPKSGAASPSNPLAKTIATPTVTVAGFPAQVLFSGLAPGLVGEYQVNILVPAGAPTGNAVPVVILIGGVASNTVTMAVAQPSTQNPSPTITHLSPSAVPAGSASTTLTIEGSGFISSSQITLGAFYHPAKAVNSTQLQITLTPADLGTIGNFGVQVINPPPGGGSSNVVNFTVSSTGVVIIHPTSVVIPEGGVQNFSGSVPGVLGGGRVTWSVQEGSVGGMIGSDGTYVAPGQTGTFHVVATNAENPSQSAVATVRVTPTSSFSVISSFPTMNSGGGYPSASLIQPRNSPYFYGTMELGPGGFGGAVFEMDNLGNTAVLGNVNTQNITQPPNISSSADSPGLVPSLVQASDGNLYGTDAQGGSMSIGSVFKVDSSGNITTIYSFAVGFNGAQGDGPAAPLIQGADGYLYGTTYYGGNTSPCLDSSSGCGTVFKVDTSGNFTLLHAFSGPDGAHPAAPLIQAADGYFYGTTAYGGTVGYGTIFRMDTSGNVTVLHSFPAIGMPLAGLLQASDGYLYGTASGGGLSPGLVFRIDKAGNFAVVYNFSGTDGSFPAAPLFQASDGHLYGTTWGGGNLTCGPNEAISGYPYFPVGGCGTVFKMDLSGDLTVVHAFSGTDGIGPVAGLIQGPDGLLYGTTFYGGPGIFFGEVYQLALPPP
jgi:uncharacterized protein (TIGR03437 family)